MSNESHISDSALSGMIAMFPLSTTTELNEVPAQTLSFSAESYRLTTLSFYSVMGVVAVFGILSNLVNIVVFTKQGVRESTTFSFLSLAVTDLGICIATFSAFVCFFINKYHPSHNVDVNAMRRVCIYVRIAFSEMSMFTTVFLSMERCLCVIRPLSFKKIINRNRTMVILCLLYIEVIVWYGLFFANLPMVWKFDSRKNMTRFTTTYTDDYDTIQNIHTYTNGFFVPIILVSLVTLSTFFMIFGLWRASKFRSKSSSTSNTADGDKGKTSAISSKESKLVKIVIYLLVIFIATYIFVFAIDIIDKVEMEIEFYVFMTLWTVAHLIAVLNASANAVVYYGMSTKYREIFDATFCGAKAKRQVGGATSDKYTASTGASAPTGT